MSYYNLCVSEAEKLIEGEGSITKYRKYLANFADELIQTSKNDLDKFDNNLYKILAIDKDIISNFQNEFDRSAILSAYFVYLYYNKHNYPEHSKEYMKSNSQIRSMLKKEMSNE